MNTQQSLLSMAAEIACLTALKMLCIAGIYLQYLTGLRAVGLSDTVIFEVATTEEIIQERVREIKRSKKPRWNKQRRK